jgi:broad specificity phosphatase PhoE
MLTILLIRAGRTEFDREARIQGTLDVPLSDEGRLEAEAAAAELVDTSASVTALYAGPCLSAQQTAEIVGEKLRLKHKTLSKLHNLNQGLWQGMLFEDVKSKQPKVYRQWQDHPETVCPPEGETLSAAAERLKLALAKLSKKHKTGAIGLVLAPPLARVLRSMLRAEHLPCVCQAECASRPLWEPLDVPVVSH